MSDVGRIGRRASAGRGRHATLPADGDGPAGDPDGDAAQRATSGKTTGTGATGAETTGATSSEITGTETTGTETTSTDGAANHAPDDTVPYASVRSALAARREPRSAGQTPPGQPEDPAPTPDADSAPAGGLPTGEADGVPRHRRRWPGRVALAVVLLLLVALVVATVHLFRTSTAWEERADAYLGDARDVGAELAAERAELAGTRAELAAVRDQLATAHARIVDLADEKAQIGDDREVQRQLVDYQERVSDAAGQVAQALDQCVQGQQELIGYLQQTVEGTEEYEPTELDRFTSEVEALCQASSEANIALQRELSR